MKIAYKIVAFFTESHPSFMYYQQATHLDPPKEQSLILQSSNILTSLTKNRNTSYCPENILTSRELENNTVKKQVGMYTNKN